MQFKTTSQTNPRPIVTVEHVVQKKWVFSVSPGPRTPIKGDLEGGGYPRSRSGLPLAAVTQDQLREMYHLTEAVLLGVLLAGFITCRSGSDHDSPVPLYVGVRRTHLLHALTVMYGLQDIRRTKVRMVIDSQLHDIDRSVLSEMQPHFAFNM